MTSVSSNIDTAPDSPIVCPPPAAWYEYQQKNQQDDDYDDDDDVGFNSNGNSTILNKNRNKNNSNNNNSSSDYAHAPNYHNADNNSNSNIINNNNNIINNKNGDYYVNQELDEDQLSPMSRFSEVEYSSNSNHSHQLHQLHHDKYYIPNIDADNVDDDVNVDTNVDVNADVDDTIDSSHYRNNYNNNNNNNNGYAYMDDIDKRNIDGDINGNINAPVKNNNNNSNQYSIQSSYQYQLKSSSSPSSSPTSFKPKLTLSTNKSTSTSSSIFRQKVKHHHHQQQHKLQLPLPLPSSPTTPSTSQSKFQSQEQKTSKPSSTHQNLQKSLKSFQSLTTQYLPNAAQEIIYTSTRNIFHYSLKSYNQSLLFGKLQLKFSELGNKVGGYDYDSLYRNGICDVRNGEVLWTMSHIYEKHYYQQGQGQNYGQSQGHGHGQSHGQSQGRNQQQQKQYNRRKHKNNRHSNSNSKYGNDKSSSLSSSSSPMGLGWEDEWDRQRIALPPFSSLNWVDRQLVKEWRTFDYTTSDTSKMRNKSNSNGGENETNEKNSSSSSSSSSSSKLNNDNGKSSMTRNTQNQPSSSLSSPSEFASQQQQQQQQPQQQNEQNDDLLQNEEIEFDQARTFIPKPMPRPPWENASTCYTCRKSFNSTRLRHHCRLCGRSYCHTHSKYTHRLPYLGYDPDVPERTCGQCKEYLDIQNLAERIAWRMARCRDHLASPMDLCPYFETGVDTVEDVAVRLTKAALHMAKSIPLGAQATVAVETLDVMRKHGLKGVYGLILRKEFMAAADLLCKVTGINKKAWPLSVHELSAAIFYALAQHRAIRGVDPEREHRIHALKPSNENDDDDSTDGSIYSVPSVEIIDDDKFLPTFSCSDHLNRAQNNDAKDDDSSNEPIAEPVCEAVSDSLLASLIFYAPVAMNFIYATSEVDMQLLAAQQGWRLIYAHLKQDVDGSQVTDMPASALFVHMEQNIACFTVRGTATINDVVTDIRAMPVQFPDTEMNGPNSRRSGKRGDDDDDDDEDEWTQVSKGQGLALCGMAGAAYNLFRENIEALLLFARQGYRIRLVGHSLGGSVAALLGVLVRRELQHEIYGGSDKLSKEKRFDKLNQNGKKSQKDKLKIDDLLRVYSYGSPACVDGKLSDHAKSYVTNCILHDDVIPRLTPTSIRALLKHLLYIRETWVKAHLHDDLMAITERAKTAWAPRLRNGFTLMSTKKPSIKMYKKLKAKGSSLQKRFSGVKKKGINPPITDVVVENIKAKQLESNDNGISEAESLLYDGDCFYEAEESLIENSDEEENGDEVILSERRKEGKGLLFGDDKDAEEFPDSGANSSQAVLLEETPLPRMFIPGKIVHIYTHRGGYKLAQVPRAFRELRRISLAANMLTDHMSKSYYEALLECKLIRRAVNDLPKWTGFDDESTCSCCGSRFTWASTSDTEAQEARDKHNCRSCGGLVCDACSENRVPVSDIGINAPSRVCDRCYHDMGAVLTDSSALTRSFMEDDDNDADEKKTNPSSSTKINTTVKENEEAIFTTGDEKDCNTSTSLKPKPKRSAVVDELILKMPMSVPMPSTTYTG